MSSQSGALGIAILEYARANHLGISQFVSVGNKADVSGNDLLLAWEDDPQTDVTGSDPVLTGKIALAHLKEFPDYYTRLGKMEAEASSSFTAGSGRSGG